MSDNVEEMTDEQALRQLLDQSEDLEFRRKVRARLRQLKKEASPAIVSDDKPKTQDVSFLKIQKSPEKPRPSRPIQPPQKQENGSEREFLERSSILRSVKTDSTYSRSSTGMQLPQVSLRSALKTDDVRKSTPPQLETVVLRKVAHDSKASKEQNPRLRSNAPKVTPKMAFEKFKEMDIIADGSLLGVGGGGARRRSPSPNSIREQMLNWCRARVSCYNNVEIDDFSASWNDGMAFCALIHSFYPEAFDYDLLDRKDKAKNFQLAFDTAEKLADVVPLLEVEDMVSTSNPDWKCVFTYVNSIANRMSEIRRERKNAELKEQERAQKIAIDTDSAELQEQEQDSE